MPPVVLAALTLIALAGAAIAVQAPVNARLARHLGDPLTAAAISFGTGFLVLAFLALLRGAVPSGAALRSVPWWAWSGGVLGSLYVASAAWSVGRIGVVTLVAALIFGQMAAALVLDGTGAFGLTRQPASLTRVIAVGLVAAGVVLSRF